MEYEYIFEEVRVKPSNAPKFVINGKEVDIWSEEFAHYHSKSIPDYIRENLLRFESKGVDPFSEIVGKALEKEMVKTALMSGSNILFKGKKHDNQVKNRLRKDDFFEEHFKAFTRENTRHKGV